MSLTIFTGLENANKALAVSLVAPSSSGLKLVAKFHPKFTYTIFGDGEKIFGYKDLKISLRFRANDMRPHLHTSYSQKLKPPPGVDQPTDVAAVLGEGGHLPKGWFSLASFSQPMADSPKLPLSRDPTLRIAPSSSATTGPRQEPFTRPSTEPRAATKSGKAALPIPP